MNKRISKIVRATAGAGKTTGLLEAVYDVYKSFYARKGVWPKILLSTFTVKAANELSERLISKAVELNDDQFLDYVSSSFLEVGTLHSVFLRIIDQINDGEFEPAGDYFSQAQRSKIGRGILHSIIKEESLYEFFLEARDEEHVLETFLHIYANSNEQPKVLSKEEIFLRVDEQLKEMWGGISGEIKDEKFKDLLEELTVFEDIINYIESLEKKDLRKCKELLKFLKDETNSEAFIKRYSLKHKAFRGLYVKWSCRFKEYTVENKIESISDVEVQILDRLKEKNFKQKIWDYCFFDEYQDTSPIQKKIIDVLASKSQNYFVGDPFQSIYFFRGARKEIFLSEFDSIQGACGETEYRLNNYRSAPEIVDFANGLTKYLLPDFLEMEACVSDVCGEVKVCHFKDGTERDEFLYVRDELQKIDLNSESVAVLSRGAKSLLSCGKELRKAGVPYKFSLSKGFSSSLEIIELVSFLKFLLDSSDNNNLLILLMSFWVQVSDREIQKTLRLIEEKEVESLWGSLSENEELTELSKLLGKVGELPFSALLSEFVGVVGFLNFTEALDSTGDRERNILKLISALELEESRSGFSLLGFCDDILSGAYRFESEDVKSDKGCLLMTVHGSKGLQFDHVFIIGMNKSSAAKGKKYYFDLEKNIFSLKEKVKTDLKLKFPLAVEELVLKEKAEVSSEGRRLLYVAMTRAKKSLFLLGSKKIPKTSVAPSWLNLTIDFLENSGQAGLFEELDPYDDLGEREGEGFLEGGFLKFKESSEFLEKSSLAVTQSVGGATKKQTEKLEYSSDEGKLSHLSFSIAEGVLFHEMMERIDNFDEAMEEIPKCFPGDHEKHRAAVRYLFEQKKFPISKILVNGNKEWGFDFVGKKRISGKIDLWSKLGDEVWIVDYKTGDSSGVEKGFKQLMAYKEMVSLYLNDGALRYSLVLTFPYSGKTFIEEGV